MPNEDKPTVDAAQDVGTSTEDSQDQIDDVYKGKSLEDIVKMHKELKSHSDRQLETIKGEKDKEVATLKKDLQAYQSWYSQAQQQSAPQPTQPQHVDQSKLVDALLENPVQTINQILDYRRQSEMYQEAYSEGPSALVRAKKDRPDIFEGVDDNQLQQIVFGGIQSGQLHPSLAKRPEAWMMAAGQTKLVQNDFRFQPIPPKPTQPLTGDKPPGVKPQVGDRDEEDDVEFDPLTQELMEAFGKTKTQVAEQVNKWRKHPDPRIVMTERE